MNLVSLQNFFILLSYVLFFSCSAGTEMPKENNQVDTFDDGMYLAESGEDGVMELVIPEVVEYTALKDAVEEKENLQALELGSQELDIEKNIEIKESIAAIGEVEPIEVESAEEYSTISRDVSVNSNDDFETYEVQKNDSLMLISFKVYNNFERWKEIAQWNGIDTTEQYIVQVGKKLKLKISDDYNKLWKPEGEAYLIQRGDYLGKISKLRYEGRPQYWYDIWKNNELLIKNPDNLYVGFTIYTPAYEVVIENEKKRKLNKRSLASEPL